MDDCIFCKIIEGKIPCETVYENDELLAILDAFPANPGHVLIIPKKHSKNAFDIDAEQAAGAFKLAVIIAKAMEGFNNVEGVNILQNNNEVSGQTVFHFHIHVIPRYKGDGVSVKWKPGGYGEGEAAAHGEAIRKKISF